MVHGLSCSAVWDVPGPGIKPLAPVLAGGFLTTEPPGKPQIILNLFRPRKRNTLGQVQHRLNCGENFFLNHRTAVTLSLNNKPKDVKF